MFKHFLLLLIMMVSFTMPAGAISLQELQTLPNFKLVTYEEYPSGSSNHVDKFYSFINLDSIHIVEYNPPKYVLQGTSYMVFDYENSPFIRETEMTVYYDINYSLANLIHSNLEKQQNSSLVDVISAAENHPGIVAKLKSGGKYKLNGEKWYTENRSFFTDAEWMGPVGRSRYNENTYNDADALFKAVYLQNFDDILVQ